MFDVGVSAPVMRILYVDDEILLHLLTRKILERRGGFQVQVCGEGAAVPEMVRAFRPDVILLDVMMPEMDGPAVLTTLRADPELAAVPVIFLTGQNHPEEIASLMALSPIGILTKPCDPLTLCDDIRRLWQQASTTAAHS